MNWRYSAFVLLTILLLPLPSAGKEIGPEADFCAEINALTPGEELVLRGGEYQGPCTIRRGGSRGAPIIIRADDYSHPPRIVYQGQSDNVINIRADYVTVRGLHIGPTRADVDGIRIYAGSGITVEDCQFSDMGGIAVVANHNSVRGLIVQRNIMTNASATAMYFGCHDGTSCVVSDLRVENNFISGVTAPDPEIGYGIEVKLNSYGIIHDNIVVNTKGPGIMVYGATDPVKRSWIERNFVSGSRTSAGIVIGGGPGTVRNNIAASNREAGITLQDYGKRGLLKGILVTHNTIYNNAQAGILLSAGGPVEALISYNAVAPESGMPSERAQRSGLKVFENQGCTSDCFVNPEKGNFTPVKNSPLVGGERRVDVVADPASDFFGRPRPRSPAIGAVEPPGGTVQLGIKPSANSVSPR